MSETRVTVEIDNEIAIVRLNRPSKVNAFDFQMFQELDATAKKLKSDRTIRGIILTGAGGNFSSGLDIKSLMTNTQAGIKLLLKVWPGSANLAQRVSTHWKTMPVPVIAVIEGKCWGAGMQVVLGCDFRYATKDSSLAIMESKWGLLPDMAGSIGLRQIMPLDQAMKLTLTSDPIDGAKAKELGLVTEVCDNPLADAKSFLESLCEKSPDAMTAIKSHYQKAWHGNWGTQLYRETWYQLKLLMGKNRVQALKRQKGGKESKFFPRSF